MVTATREDYLRALYKLGGDEGKVGVTTLADHMGLAKSTVTERLQGMAENKIVKYERYKPLQLTRKGKNLAKKLTYKHRIIEVFLHDTLKMKGNVIHEEAHQLEHAFSDDAIQRLARFLGNPKVDPHGSPIVK